jgi:hypothetical protein
MTKNAVNETERMVVTEVRRDVRTICSDAIS